MNNNLDLYIKATECLPILAKRLVECGRTEAEAWRMVATSLALHLGDNFLEWFWGADTQSWLWLTGAAPCQ